MFGDHQDRSLGPSISQELGSRLKLILKLKAQAYQIIICCILRFGSGTDSSGKVYSRHKPLTRPTIGTRSEIMKFLAQDKRLILSIGRVDNWITTTVK
jgi:hypothetical protein